MERNATACQPRFEGLAFQQLRNDVGHSILTSDVIHRQQVWMIQRGKRAGLSLKSIEGYWISVRIGADRFDRDLTL